MITKVMVKINYNVEDTYIRVSISLGSSDRP